MSGRKTTSWIAVTATRHRAMSAAGWCGNNHNKNFLEPLAIPKTKRETVRTKSSRIQSSHYNNNYEQTKLRPEHLPVLNGIAKTKKKKQKEAIAVGIESSLQSLVSPKTTTIVESVSESESASEALSPPYVSPSELTFTGDTPIPITSRLEIVTPEHDTPRGTWPVFRIMDEDGSFRDGISDGYRHDASQALDPSSQGRYRVNGSQNDPKRCDENENENENKNNDPSLSALRDSLRKEYPNHSSVIARSGLFEPSEFVHTDTNSRDSLQRLLRHMLRLREMDSVFHDAQRQGRLSFYLTCRGEEGIHFGAASALEQQDVILGQYREQGPLMWRGFTLQQFADQCLGNVSDLGKGRQMPIHYGSRALNYQTISSPLGTQIPQAVGVALRLKMMAAADSSVKKGVSIAFFGEGCTSTTDFHSGLNFAATLKCPVLFLCRNNGYAISTSTKEQFAGDGVVSRAPGYGMAGIRVDGNDVFAVHAAVREARAYALEHNAPVLIEAMSYRQGHHSTSDDSFQYRSADEVNHFARESDPLDRLQNFFRRHVYHETTDDQIKAIIEEEKKHILDALRTAERKPKPPLEDLFTDVYKDMPPSLKAQQIMLNKHIAKYPDSYAY